MFIPAVFGMKIHAEGGRYIGRALRSNTSLVSLNLRLNRLTDEGGRMLVEGLHDNPTLACLNLRCARGERPYTRVASGRVRDGRRRGTNRILYHVPAR